MTIKMDAGVARYATPNSKMSAFVNFPELQILILLLDSLIGLDSDIVVATVNPPAVQLIPWVGKVDVKTCLIRHMNFLLDKTVMIVSMSRFPKSTTQTWCMSDGKAYIVYYTPNVTEAGSTSSVWIMDVRAYYHNDIRRSVWKLTSYNAIYL